MFQIKICGITCVEDALAVRHAGGDAIGLNFAAQSVRCVDLQQAKEISAALGEGVLKVGVFVNAAPAEVFRTANTVGLDVIQLHGDEPPEYLPQLAPLPVVKAFRVRNRPQPLGEVADYLAACRRLGCLPSLVLLDAFSLAGYGGTGEQIDWRSASQYPLEPWHPPLVLAGGLNPDNVAEAISIVRPAAVDVASGVESSPGKKNPALVGQFVVAARRAFGRLREIA
jgi:phosphoribosylanthranilate isomerase